MAVKGLNPYDLSDLLKGPCRVLRAPLDTDVPTMISDIIGVDKGNYEPADGWLDFGATTQGTAYSRQFSESGTQIEQATGDVDSEITDVVRAVSASFAEISPELLQIFEQAANIDTVAAAKGHSAEKQVKFGTVESTEAYRIAFVGRRAKGQGSDVKESGGKVRGALVAGVLLRAKLTGDQASLALAKGQISSAGLTFQAFADSSQPEGEEHGLWMLEQAGTISAT